MKKLRRRLFILAILFAMFAAVGSYVYLESLDERPVVVKEQTYTVFVASRDIPARSKITEDMISEVRIPFKSESTQFFNDKENIVGKYVVTKIYAESQFHKESLDVGLEEELSLKISGNMRAVSVGVSGNSGVANLVRPGDFVDVVVFLPELKENSVLIRPDIIKIILQNVEVLAVDQDLTSEKEEMLDDVKTEGDSQKSYLATLAVPVFNVELLILAKNIGMLELVLRPLEGDYAYVTEGVIWQELLIDDFDRLKDIYPSYEVNSIGDVIVKPDEVTYDKYIYYTVEYGNTLKEISLLFYGTEEYYLLIQQVNNIKDEDVISAGMGLKIPVLEN